MIWTAEFRTVIILLVASGQAARGIYLWQKGTDAFWSAMWLGSAVFWITLLIVEHAR